MISVVPPPHIHALVSSLPLWLWLGSNQQNMAKVMECSWLHVYDYITQYCNACLRRSISPLLALQKSCSETHVAKNWEQLLAVSSKKLSPTACQELNAGSRVFHSQASDDFTAPLGTLRSALWDSKARDLTKLCVDSLPFEPVTWQLCCKWLHLWQDWYAATNNW